MRVERAQRVLANVEINMAKWKQAIVDAKTQEDRQMFYELYKVQSQASRRIEDAIESIVS